MKNWYPLPSYRWTDRDCGCSRLPVGLDMLNVARLRYATKVVASKHFISQYYS